MNDRGFFLTLNAVRRQLGGMPSDRYLLRLIDSGTRRAVPGNRLWTAEQLTSDKIIGFLRARNREGCDVYIQPYAGNQNAGFILVDLDRPGPAVIERMRADRFNPCVIVQTSPGHLQAWIQIRAEPVAPGVATAAAKRLAQTYGGDLASADWRHLGRLAGFTNQKPARRAADGNAPWVMVVHASAGVAPRATNLLHSLQQPQADLPVSPTRSRAQPEGLPIPDISVSEAAAIYSGCVAKWRIQDRFAHPDWSIVDLWVARHLLSRQVSAPHIQQVLRLASPNFPRRHGDPGDYLRRTLARAAAFPFPRAPRALCAPHADASSSP